MLVIQWNHIARMEVVAVNIHYHCWFDDEDDCDDQHGLV